MSRSFAGPRARGADGSKVVSPVCLRLRLAEQRLAWESEAEEAGVTLSELVRELADEGIARRGEVREAEERRRAEVAANPLVRFDHLLERARGGVTPG
jgi:hypothetical protein